jgi:hypothetical protein
MTRLADKTPHGSEGKNLLQELDISMTVKRGSQAQCCNTFAAIIIEGSCCYVVINGIS